MSLLISSVFTYDEDAGNYIQAVETADAQALEPATRQAINNFVLGCKADGIWSAIKASCILAGARTLAGALVPLVGTAPTNNGFIGIGTDYVRKTGLVGNGSTKYLNSNRNNNADPQNSKHVSIFISTLGTLPTRRYIAAGDTSSPGDTLIAHDNATRFYVSVNNSGFNQPVGAAGFVGASRNVSTSYSYRASKTTSSIGANSGTPTNENIGVFANSSGANHLDARLAFYSIGESLDLARLDARVTELINAFAVTIP